jgi:CRISPR-associated protein Cmr1
MGGIFHRAEFRLQVITPLFMYGVGDEAELRTQSFKGMMRWWWRAVRAEEDTERLFEEEGDIFGYADRGASKVWLEVFPPRNYRRSMEVSVEVESTENEKKSKIYKYSVNIGEIGGEVGLTWESEKKRLRGEHYGIAYLLYSILMLSGGRVSYVPPGTEFKLVLKSMDGDALKIAVASLWCASILLQPISLQNGNKPGNFCHLVRRPQRRREEVLRLQDQKEPSVKLRFRIAPQVPSPLS